MLSSKPEDRLARARVSLEGLSVGDSFGERFFGHADVSLTMIRSRAVPNPPWYYTDDTNMALSIFEVLRRYGELNQDELALSYAGHYDSMRGYGPAMHRLLDRIRNGEPWKAVSYGLFDGSGSYGNGAAMRVAPLGAYFADSIDLVVEQAKLSAEVTHAHPEGSAGAIAVAVAAAYACQLSNTGERPGRKAFIDLILPHVPTSEVRSRIQRARDIAETTHVEHVAQMVGNGYLISAQDTVAFTLWCTGEALHHYEDALWLTAEGLGDIDTNCAIVGGIVACYTGKESIPEAWVANREALPDWAFQE